MFLSKCLNAVFRIMGRQTLSSASIERILCVKLDEIGDMVGAVNVFAELKLAFPNAKIDVLCKPFVKTLIEYDPNVDRILLNYSEMEKYDIWVELRGNWTTFWKSIWRTRIFRADRGTVRFKQRGNQAHETLTNFRIIEPMLRNFCESLNTNDSHFTPKLFAHASHTELAKNRLLEIGVNGKFVVIHPAARRELRQWPADRFAQISRYLWENHHLLSVVVGTKDESHILNSIKNNADYIKTLETRDSLLVLHEIICMSELFIGNESGPLQIANATGKPVIGLFGPGVPNVFYPYQNSDSVVIHKVLDCNPCNQIKCVKTTPCIELITYAEVTSALEKLLSTK